MLADVDEFKREQMAHFDEDVDAEFETTRPHAQPRFYGRLLTEKFRRAVHGIDGSLPGARVLCVCAGSGLDGEFLAGRGAHVVATDISLGAARRTAERARRFGVDVIPVVADVERLPFADRSFDVVFVHDGLHHIERPLEGLKEMARVAAHAVCVTEPAQAAATRLATRVGLAEDEEEAGNRVARLTVAAVCETLEPAGFRIRHAERYAMLYRHEPGLPMRLLSLPLVFPLAVAGWRAANALVGNRIGNKLAVVAVRE